jgi:filamentous hemagglutinin
VNAAALRDRLTAEEISGGHAFDKHVVQQGEFPGTTTRQQFAGQIEDVIRNHTHYRELSNGRVAYWDDATGTVVIRNPKAVDGGTAFKPRNGKAYFDGLK